MARLALLRGINLARHRRVAMAELRQAVVALGWTGVATYLQSGNLVFQAPGSDPEVAAQLSGLLRERFGLDVDVVIRDGARLATLLAGQPYPEGDPARTVIACCDRAVPEPAVARLAALRIGDERFALAESGCDLYAIFPDGQARSRLAAGLIDALAPATGTARNLRTMTALSDLLSAKHAG
ncbi:uncharacterized protein (DUF1697 family) [Propionicimonas paludicola]|uniref:Uncharacterized protein (DUF1697 family) n=1 Tax=Propionicimonas paludicola TaxID=185243 RepID=A0A2A9CT67_9ACTN|nr:DUF1697 domain-containing protein [Propionicimonas paludicola]PFG16759.1 uncharacterized protein (DUF1697 family) [Propionicimonas paludicola]